MLPGCSLGCCLPQGETQPQAAGSLSPGFKKSQVNLIKAITIIRSLCPLQQRLHRRQRGVGKTLEEPLAMAGSTGEQTAEPGSLRQEPPPILAASLAAVSSPARARLGANNAAPPRDAVGPSQQRHLYAP